VGAATGHPGRMRATLCKSLGAVYTGPDSPYIPSPPSPQAAALQRSRLWPVQEACVDPCAPIHCRRPVRYLPPSGPQQSLAQVSRPTRCPGPVVRGSAIREEPGARLLLGGARAPRSTRTRACASGIDSGGFLVREVSVTTPVCSAPASYKPSDTAPRVGRIDPAQLWRGSKVGPSLGHWPRYDRRCSAVTAGGRQLAMGPGRTRVNRGNHRARVSGTAAGTASQIEQWGQRACDGVGAPYSDTEGGGVPLRPSCTGRAADENPDNRDDAQPSRRPEARRPQLGRRPPAPRARAAV